MLLQALQFVTRYLPDHFFPRTWHSKQQLNFEAARRSTNDEYTVQFQVLWLSRYSFLPQAFRKR